MSNEFEDALTFLADNWPKPNPEPETMTPPFDNPLDLLAGSQIPIRRIHPVFTCIANIESGGELDKPTWSKVVEELQRAGFHQEHIGKSKERRWTYKMPKHIWDAYHTAHPDYQAKLYPNDDLDKAIADACRIYTWAYMEGIIEFQGESPSEP